MAAVALAAHAAVDHLPRRAVASGVASDKVGRLVRHGAV
jgi:hypothetical protein